MTGLIDSARKQWLLAHPFLAPVARFDEAVSCALAAVAPIPAAPVLAQPDWEAYLTDFQSGVPLLRSEAAGLDAAPAVAAQLESLVSQLAALEHLPEKIRLGCRALNEGFRADRSRALQAARWVLSGGDEGPLPDHPGLLRFLGWSAAIPVLEPVLTAFAERRDEGRWGHGHCPACGAIPVMGWLVPGDGVRERQLACGCCGTRWSFQRIGCAYCGNSDSGRLSILESADEGGLRLDLCEECKGYTKTWAGDGDPALLLADWTTLHLDAIALERGYQRKGVSLFEL